MASNYNPTMQGSGNWCITQISWKVNDSNSAFMCEMLSVRSLVLNGEEIRLSKGQWHLFKDKTKNKRTKLFGKCTNCAVALASFSVQCAGVAGTSQPLGPVMDSSSCSTLVVILEMHHWCCLSQLVSLLNVCVLQMFIAPNPLIVTNLIDWYLRTAYSDYNQEQDRLRNQQSLVEKPSLFPVVSFFNLHIVNEAVSLIFFLSVTSVYHS